MLQQYTPNRNVYQWELINGEARCVSDALAPTDPGAALALGRTALISILLAEVAAYDEARAMAEPDNGEARFMLDEDGEIIPNPAWALAPREINGGINPAWVAYNIARDAVDGASATVQALARIRAGSPDEGDEATLAAVLAEAQPIAPVVPVHDTGISWLEFLDLFSLNERVQVASSNDPYVAYFRLVATGLGGDMHINDPRVAQGLDALIAAGLIDAERKARVLSRQKPEE